MNQRIFAKHGEPVWRSKANFIINAGLQEPDRYEQLSCRRIGENEFELCCIPFFLYDVALGDVVRTADADGFMYAFDGVLRRSGRFVFRVWFGASFHPRDSIADALSSRGALLEWSSSNLLAVDAEDESLARSLAEFLQTEEDLEHLTFETGRL